MKQWFEGLESRERMMLFSGVIVLAVFLFYGLVWQPFHSGYERLQNTISEQRTTALWIQEGAAKVQQLKGAGRSGAQGLGGRSLLAVTDSTARAGGLAASMKRIEPEGRNGVRVWLEGASFDQFVTWLGLLSNKYGINPDSVSMERGDAAGQVDVRLTLQAAQS